MEYGRYHFFLNGRSFQKMKILAGPLASKNQSWLDSLELYHREISQKKRVVWVDVIDAMLPAKRAGC
jgi:hypothetical protein